MNTTLKVDQLRVAFRTRDGLAEVVRGIDLALHEGEITGLVGESGCGKSVTALALLGLLRKHQAQVSAQRMQLGEQDLLTVSEHQLSALRGRKLAMVFQEPSTSLDPVFTIGTQLVEVIRRCRSGQGRSARDIAREALGQVGFADPLDAMSRYPHELSGGMRQLVMLAMAMSVRPTVLIADEPTTALDVTTQSLVLAQLDRLRRDHGTSVLLITHDLAVMAQICDRVLVMYDGRIVEQASATQLLESPGHPYTRGLLQAVPRLSRDVPEPVRAIPGHPPVSGEALPACAFAPRCKLADSLCHATLPRLRPVGSGLTACHHAR